MWMHSSHVDFKVVCNEMRVIVVPLYPGGAVDSFRIPRKKWNLHSHELLICTSYPLISGSTYL